MQGHVDTIATILAKTPDGNAVTFRLQPRDREVLKYVMEKGFIALDGASLTITKVEDREGWFEVMLIAYTQDKVVTAAKPVGADVNVEVDMLGKYAAKSVESYFEGGRGRCTCGVAEDRGEDCRREVEGSAGEVVIQICACNINLALVLFTSIFRKFHKTLHSPWDLVPTDLNPPSRKGL